MSGVSGASSLPSFVRPFPPSTVPATLGTVRAIASSRPPVRYDSTIGAVVLFQTDSAAPSGSPPIACAICQSFDQVSPSLSGLKTFTWWNAPVPSPTASSVTSPRPFQMPSRTLPPSLSTPAGAAGGGHHHRRRGARQAADHLRRLIAVALVLAYGALALPHRLLELLLGPAGASLASAARSTATAASPKA